ncbi:translation elongation factor Ts [Rickettsia endosymbiont of Cardiosporidium cionae]|uniref:translation elongation factor Ts n=1 Tax=Rickettsia endosymbiont of Cardiosporidium cionae TaxID=2777155 RepID=UPI0018954635|nr:translation elongation factor Ts [Rickettsia endosymbiont of Cardiosporidium cionae]KAF8818254.1 elongation factor Ts [Rickettsia endosymbiont of Cardiosporidium cionae]
MSISASLVQQLRIRTGAPLMLCKKALSENNADIQEAMKWLRLQGAAAAAKKNATSIAVEGVVALAVEGNRGSIVEINSDTDFVARNECFQNLVTHIAQSALSCTSLEHLLSFSVPFQGKTVSDILEDNISVLRENIQLRRMKTIDVTKGIISSYVHNSLGKDMGKIAVLLSIESEADHSEIGELGFQIAMHIADSNPLAISRDSLDEKIVENEKKFHMEQIRKNSANKPESVINKMMEGKMIKFFSDNILLDQPFLFDRKTKIGDLILQFSKKIGKSIVLSDFIRYQLAENIDK